MLRFPNEGCKKAYHCGKEFVLAEADVRLLPRALTFCESSEERAYFMTGMQHEMNEAIDAVEALTCAR